MKTRKVKILKRIKKADLEFLTDLNIVDLVYDWYYEKELHRDVEQMYLNGSVELDYYKTSRNINQIIEDYLFIRLEEEHNIKNPYTSIPLDLDYVLSLVK